MGNADPTRIANHIQDILNASSAGWGGTIDSGRRSAEAIEQARIESGMEVLRAIASNPQNPHYAALVNLVDVEHGAQLPDFDGVPGIPVIVPFVGADPREGIPADPDEIDSYRADVTDSPIYTGALDGTAVAHDQRTQSGRMSPVACRYSLVNGRLKFTGLSAQVPLVILTRTMADTGIPENYEPTVVKLAIAKLVKEGDNLERYAPAYAAAGKQDLIEIMGGAPKVPPVPDIVMAQKAI